MSHSSARPKPTAAKAYVVITADGYINAIEHRAADGSAAQALLIVVLRAASGKATALGEIVDPEAWDEVVTVTVQEETPLPPKLLREPLRTLKALGQLTRARAAIRRALRGREVTAVVGWRGEFYCGMVSAIAAPSELVYLDFGVKLLAKPIGGKKVKAARRRTVEHRLRALAERHFCPPLRHRPEITYFTAFPEGVPPEHGGKVVENGFAYHRDAYARRQAAEDNCAASSETPGPEVIIVGHTQFTKLPYEAMLSTARDIAGDDARIAYYMHPREAEPTRHLEEACRRHRIVLRRDDRPLELAFLFGTARRCRELIVTHYTTALPFLRQVIGDELRITFLLSEKRKVARTMKLGGAIEDFIAGDTNVRRLVVDREEV